MIKYNNYDKFPEKKIDGYKAFKGYDKIITEIKEKLKEEKNKVVVLELYPECNKQEILDGFKSLNIDMIDAETCALSDSDYQKLISPFVTDDRVFGIMNTLTFKDVYVQSKIDKMQQDIKNKSKPVLLYGVGASYVYTGDILIYADLARWEIQKRFKKGTSNWKTDNSNEDRLKKFKQGFFVEWRIADRQKRAVYKDIDYLLDTNIQDEPKMVCGKGYRHAIEKFASEPFRLVPYFAPEVWGGQWMKEVCGLDKSEKNYAWAFDGVVEENSIYINFDGVRIEVPSINVVFAHPKKLLGNKVHARFGDEFPIRFDFLDTFGGQNLSLQVHPLTEYIQHTFGMHYTQDESYYILDCNDNVNVYLGLKENVDSNQMITDLEQAQKGEIKFDADKYVNTFPIKKHDHVSIPAGTIHCSCTDTMVLEISATPYIFTFKLWDWSRLGLDGKPRPVHVNHGKKVIQWDRTTEWIKENLINPFKTLEKVDDYLVEETGLHERQFVKTIRYSLENNKDCIINSQGSFSICNVVDGKGAIIESLDNSFEPFEVHYAETFIIPESVSSFKIKPLEKDAKIIRAIVKC